MEGRGALLCWAGLQEALHTEDYTRVTIRVEHATASSSDTDDVGSVG